MRLKLTLLEGSHVDDLTITIDPTATVGQLAERLRRSHPRAVSTGAAAPGLCVRVNPGTPNERTVAAHVTVSESAIRSGDAISISAGGGHRVDGRGACSVTVVDGPDRGAAFSIPIGTSRIGRDRDCEIRLADPLVSKRHAKLIVGDAVELVDDNSANGTLVNGEPVQRSLVRPGDRVTLGDTHLHIDLVATSAGQPGEGGSIVAFNRSPRLDPPYAGIELVAPQPPEPPNRQRLPMITLVAPVLMGAAMYAVTRNVLSILFVGLSPIMMIGSYLENRRAGRRQVADAAVHFRAALRDLAVELQHAFEAERKARRAEHPSLEELLPAAHRLGPLLWTRRSEHAAFAQVRLGLGRRRSRNTVILPQVNRTVPELWQELRSVVAEFSVVDRVPVVADLRSCGNIGVAGPATLAQPAAAGLVAQLVTLHSPADLIVSAITAPSSAAPWRWLKWLPHTGSEHSPIAVEHLAASGPATLRLVAALEDLVQVRSEGRGANDAQPLPLVVVVVEDDAADERPRLVALAERGPAVGVHLLWVAPTQQRLPAACRSYLDVDGAGTGRIGQVHDDDGVDPVELEPLEPNAAHALARVLSPVVDAGALVEDHSDLPASVAFLALAGPDLADNPAEIVEHWRGNHSIPEPDAPRLKRDNTLRALVGQTATDRCYLDLRADGPHALVGGTTGAGKSEFLQTWILGLAAAHSPARVNFLLVDYKGGTAFADCVELPHCVGLVTDLTPHLVRRALTSLRAELRRREGILNSSRAKDLLELERLRDPSAPPSLVIVVDEFAALVSEVPEFVDGVVDIAQRGRSLGLHLVLATQRPAGVIKGSLRANTNLRIALRVADPEDSTDIVGTPVATDFDPSAPGRAVARTGPGRLTHFQTAYLGGRTTNIAPPPSIEIAELPFSVGAPWEDPEPGPAAPGEHGPADIRRLVDGIRAAHAQVALPAARRPWLPELSPVYRLEDLPSERTDRLLAFGVVDRPAQQDQAVVAFYPDRDGNMAVYGTGGSGKSTFLRSIAVAAGLAPARGGPCHVYAIDCGARGLAMLEGLPHVGAVLNGDDGERVLRLLKQLRATIDERSARYAAASAATIVEYRQRSGAAHEPRILLLIDNFGSFRQTYEIGRQGSALDLLESIAAEGRAVGVHLLATADQVNAFTTSLRSVIQSRLALRLSSDVDLLALGVPTDVFGASTPAGRGFLDGDEVQVAVLGGDSNLARQAAAMARFAAAVARQPVPAAPPIARLQERITSAEVSQRPGDRPVLGIWDETLEPLTFEPAGAFIVAGPPGSGRSSTVASMLHSLKLVGGRSRVVRFGPRRSPLAALDHVEHVCDVDESSRVAAELTQALRERNPTVHGLVAVIENVSDFANGPAADALQQLIRAARTEGAFVIIEGETPAFNGNYGLIGAAKLDRTGIVLQPDQNDGDYVLGTSFPRVQRRDFPPGRGLHVRAGRVYRVQVLAPVPA